MKTSKLFYVLLLSLCFVCFVSGKAKANYDPALIPDGIVNGSDGVNCSGRFSASGAYVSIQGDTKTIRVRVPRGTTSVNLQLNFWTKLCNTSEYWKSVTYQGQSGSYPPLVSIGGSLRYGPSTGEWNLVSNAFVYTPPTGSFQSSGVYNLDYYWKSINSNKLFAPSGTRFACVGGGESASSYNQFSKCGTIGYFQFQIEVEVYDVNPVGYADSCELVGNTTRVWGWGYENDNAGGPTVSLTVGGNTQSAAANEANYRVTAINSFLDARSYGSDARDNNYGWHIDYTGLRRGNTYGISGTLVNSGAGSNQVLGISGAFTSNNIPDSCLPAFDAYACTVNVVAVPSSNLYVQQVYSISLTIRNNGTTTWDNSFSVYNDASDNPATPYNEASHNSLAQNLGSVAPGASAPIVFSNLSSNIPLQINYNFKVRRNGATPGGITPFDTNVAGCTGSVIIRYCPPGSSNAACGSNASERGGYVCSIPSLTAIEVGVDTSIQIASNYSGIRTASSGSVNVMQITAGGATRSGAGLPASVSRNDVISRDLAPFNFSTAADQTASGTVTYSVPTGIFGEADYIGSANCNGTIRTGYKPYFKAYGSDTWAGGVFDVDNGASCAAGVTDRGGIYAYATGTAADNYRGASNQLPVTALLGIDQYYSGSTIASSLAGAPSKGQTFANSGATTYGGNYGGKGRCHINYFNDTRDSSLSNGTTNVSSISLPASGKKQYIMSIGNQVVPAMNIPKGVQIAVYVDGDAYITGNITFDNSARTNLTDIPNLALVVRGNIYISSSVSRLDGLYVAQPKTNDPNETSGKVYTCTKSAGTGVSRLYSAAELYANCNSQLSINGSLVAKQIKLQRVYGTLNTSAPREVPNYATGSGTRAGEVINYTPENFLAPSALRVPTDNGGTRYDSIRQLPPIY